MKKSQFTFGPFQVLGEALPPDPEEMNDERAEAAQRAIEAFALDFGEAIADKGILEQNISDLVADLGHLADRFGIDFTTILSRAALHYNEETDNQGRQFLGIIN